jgi:hypothetical protein
MRQRFVLLAVVIAVVLLLIGLNAAALVSEDKTADTESNPKRSTFNTGSTGTHALYTLLSETGRNVARWRTPVEQLTQEDAAQTTFVVIGPLRESITEAEGRHLLEWTAQGGRLVVIDRDPKSTLLPASGWRFVVKPRDEFSTFGIEPTNQTQMTSETPAVRVEQPSILASGVTAVQPSRFASAIEFRRDDSENVSDPASAPVVHLTSRGQPILVDTRLGEGSVIVLSDPYVVANGGIGLVDNAQLAINLAAADSRRVLFDEYHHGYGSNNNRFLEFFAGTPVVALFAQAGALVALVLFSRSRRFGRPVPDERVDRLSKLEYVGAMAELQYRTAAYDLAFENIYHEFRRRAARACGTDIKASAAVLAARLAERADMDAREIETLLLECEDIAYGGRTRSGRAVVLIARLRELEMRAGLARTSGGRRPV